MQNKNSSLRSAAISGRVDEICQLAGLGADVHAPDEYGNTALHLAALNEHIETVKMLVELGADKDAQDKAGRTALHWATRMGNTEMIEALQAFDEVATANTQVQALPPHYRLQISKAVLVCFVNPARGIR